MAPSSIPSSPEYLTFTIVVTGEIFDRCCQRRSTRSSEAVRQVTIKNWKVSFTFDLNMDSTSLKLCIDGSSF